MPYEIVGNPLSISESCRKCGASSTTTVGHYTYRECDRLGEGRYGTVFKGRNTQTPGQEVAIKKIPNTVLQPGEISLMRSLNKTEFLVTLLDCVEEEQSHFTFIIMELCDLDLQQHLSVNSDEGKLRERNFKVLLNSLANGYGALYREKIVHRDIKPQNILLKYSKSGQKGFPEIAVAKITDFSISRILEPDDRAVQGYKDKGDRKCMRRVQSASCLSNVAGTPYYMAPEVGANLLGEHEYDFRVDMWSIGCVLYECITGQVRHDLYPFCVSGKRHERFLIFRRRRRSEGCFSL